MLSWEFRPGAERFVGWSRGRRLRWADPFFRDQRSTTPYDRSTGQWFADAFREVPRNAFTVGFRYTIR